jgi:cobalt-zinc-cadmium efflux system membrane fusion protein
LTKVELISIKKQFGVIINDPRPSLGNRSFIGENRNELARFFRNSTMTPQRTNIWPTLALCTVLLGIGCTTGFMLRPVILPAAAPETPEDAVDAAPTHGSTSIVEILETTMENMDLKTGKFEVRDYAQNIRIPAKIVERIPQNRRRVTSPIGGHVTKVLIAEGQAIKPGEKLFEFRITDESLANAQISLLELLKQIDVGQQKIDRLKPLVDSGVVARKRLLDLEFEQSTLEQQLDTNKQELMQRGMDQDGIKNLIGQKQLMQTIDIFAPDLPEGTTAPARTEDQSPAQEYYTVESIQALEGTNQDFGSSLCELTSHDDLLIEGLAYESDIDKISKANEAGWKFTAQFGDGKTMESRDNLKLFKIENHVDSQSQTYPIFVEIKNEIVSKTTDENNRIYVNWKFKPGQRAHLEFPIEIWKDQVVVPLGAIAREGLETFVFLKISHTHEGPGGTTHEFQKVPVKVLHTDQYYAVLARSIQLDPLENYALDQAYKLNLALKQAAGGGGGAHAGHDHPH